MMIIQTLICLLLSTSLTAATPISSSDQSPSSPLDKRAASCRPLYGTNVLPDDCRDALRLMREEGPYLASPRDRYVGPLSRTPAEQRFKLPKFYRTPTCTIGLDLIDPGTSIRCSWSERVAIADILVQTCVRSMRTASPPLGLGGEDRSSDGFITVVINEARLDPVLHDIWRTCLAQSLQGPGGGDIGQCARNLGSRNAPPGPMARFLGLPKQ